jgi:carbamoyl-phosphate synthase small subunit
MPQNAKVPAILVLEDGSFFEGYSVGIDGTTIGEVVFNTSMSGYQEILTDPSYAGQMITFTAPHIGNYGTNSDDMESDKVHAEGMIVRDFSTMASNHRSDASLSQFLQDQNVIAISGVDTRSLTRKLRNGVQMGIIATHKTSEDVDELVGILIQATPYGAVDYVSQVCVRYNHTRGSEDQPHVVVIDYGVKQSIIRNLVERDLRVTVVPPTPSMDVLKDLNPDGIMLSNGPGDPDRMENHLDRIREISSEYVTFGICLGHQLLAKAYGAETFKLIFGHRGPNQPVKDLETQKVAITSQNHGFAVREETLPPELRVTHRNLNDGTVAGLVHQTLPIVSVQYHPEAGPGPRDAQNFFSQLVEALK